MEEEEEEEEEEERVHKEWRDGGRWEGVDSRGEN